MKPGRRVVLSLLVGGWFAFAACGRHEPGARISVRLATPRANELPGQVGTLAYCDRSILSAAQQGLGGISLIDRFQNAPEAFWFEKYSLSGLFADLLPLQMGQAFQLRKGGPRTLEVTGFALSCENPSWFHPVAGTKKDLNLDKPGDVILDVWVSGAPLAVSTAAPGGAIPAEVTAVKLPGIGNTFNGGTVSKAKLIVSASDRVPPVAGVAPWGFALINSLTQVPLQNAHFLGPLFPQRKYDLKWVPLNSAGEVVSTVAPVCLKIDLMSQSGGQGADLSTSTAWGPC